MSKRRFAVCDSVQILHRNVASLSIGRYGEYVNKLLSVGVATAFDDLKSSPLIFIIEGTAIIAEYLIT